MINDPWLLRNGKHVEISMSVWASCCTVAEHYVREPRWHTLIARSKLSSFSIMNCSKKTSLSIYTHMLIMYSTVITRCCANLLYFHGYQVPAHYLIQAPVLVILPRLRSDSDLRRLKSCVANEDAQNMSRSFGLTTQSHERMPTQSRWLRQEQYADTIQLILLFTNKLVKRAKPKRVMEMQLYCTLT